MVQIWKMGIRVGAQSKRGESKEEKGDDEGQENDEERGHREAHTGRLSIHRSTFWDLGSLQEKNIKKKKEREIFEVIIY